VAGEQRNSGDVEAMHAVLVAAALRYRDAMRAYMAGQAAALEQGVPLNDLMLRNQEEFHEAAQAEEVLFALLDTLDAMQVSGGIVRREQKQNR
jgi:hypothetical protein